MFLTREAFLGVPLRPGRTANKSFAISVFRESEMRLRATDSAPCRVGGRIGVTAAVLTREVVDLGGIRACLVALPLG